MKNATIHDQMILKVINELDTGDFTVTEIFKFCLAKGYDIPQSMIYKAVVNLVKLGKLQKTISNERSCRYEKYDNGKNVKIVCTTCHKELKIHDKRIDELLINIASEKKREVAESNLKIYVSHINHICQHN
ncbi:transcriptional repressor [Enterobacter hormaechei subsp. steigerwaltii]